MGTLSLLGLGSGFPRWNSLRSCLSSWRRLWPCWLRWKSSWFFWLRCRSCSNGWLRWSTLYCLCLLWSVLINLTWPTNSSFVTNFWFSGLILSSLYLKYIALFVTPRVMPKLLALAASKGVASSIHLSFLSYVPSFLTGWSTSLELNWWGA